MKVREYRSYVSGQEEVLADQSGLPCSCKSALFNKEIVITLGADSVAYISDIAKRFLKSLAENLEANHPKVVQNKGPHVFKKAVNGCFHTFGKKYRRQCLFGRS